MPAGVVFAVALLVVAAAAGWRPGRATVAAVAVGALGGGALVVAWLLSHAAPGVHIAPLNAGLAIWTPVVALVAVAEEVALRGALFNTVRSWCGDGGALVATTATGAPARVVLAAVPAAGPDPVATAAVAVTAADTAVAASPSSSL